uniref:peroxisomal testis-specific protein 1 n=1 Tax=Myodes glareolus TaxID=447135 RepID=UPI00202297DC|nr:peroxisomal testis-specific protein 1 [Myodes glareolus]
MPRNPGHSPLSQPEENNPGQGQQEEIQAVIMQLIQIGDSVHRRMTQEDPGDVLPPLVEEMVFMRGRVLLRFFWNNHWL